MFSNPNSQFNSNSIFNFGKTQTTASSGLFGSPTSTQATAGSLFSQPAASTSGGGLFGGATSRPFSFGNTASTFTTTTGTTGGGLFGGGASTLGAQPATANTGTGLFGASAAGTTGTAVIKYQPTASVDSVKRGNSMVNIQTKLCCITAMPQYENKSLTELRLEDYQANRKFPQQGTMFGGTPSATTGFGASTGGLFGSAAPAATPATSIFSPATNNFGGTSTLGKSIFGATTTTSTVSTGGLFNFGTTNAATTGTGLFGAKTATPAPFGGQTTGVFSQQPASTSSGGLFGAQTKPLFGQPTTGTTPFFGQGSTGGGGLFGMNTATTGTPSFGGTTTMSTGFGTTTSTAPGLFGAAAPATNTGLFSNTPANTGLFGAASTSTAPKFGGGSVFGGGSLFTQASSTPATGFGFGSTAAPATATSGFNFGATQPASTGGFGFGGTTAAVPSATGFSGFGAAQQPVQTASGFTGFGAPTAPMAMQPVPTQIGLSADPLEALAQQAQIQQQVLSLVSSSPYGRNSLFRDIASSSQEDDADKGQEKTSQSSTANHNLFSVSSNNGLGNLSRQGYFNRSSLRASPMSASSTGNRKTLKLLPPSRNQLFVGYDEDELGVKSPGGTNGRWKTGEASPQLNSMLSGGGESPRSPFFVSRGEWRKIHGSQIRENRSRQSLSNVGGDVRQETLSHGAGNEKSLSAFTSRQVTWGDTGASTSSTMRPSLMPSTGKASATQMPTSFGALNSPLVASSPLRGEGSRSQTSGAVAQASTSHQEVSLESHGREDSSISLPANVTLSAANQTIAGATSSTTPDSSCPAPYGIILTRPGYYTIPTIAELVQRETKELNSSRPTRECWVEDFVVGRQDYGHILFYGRTNIAGLNLDEIVNIRRREVSVYPEEEEEEETASVEERKASSMNSLRKPVIGEGLNKPAQVTLDAVWPMDRTTREYICDPRRLEEMHFASKLERATQKMGATFVDYDPQHGSWRFNVKHFSKYRYDDDEEGEDGVMEAKKALAQNTQTSGECVGRFVTEMQPPTLTHVPRVEEKLLTRRCPVQTKKVVPVEDNMPTSSSPLVDLDADSDSENVPLPSYMTETKVIAKRPPPVVTSASAGGGTYGISLSEDGDSEAASGSADSSLSEEDEQNEKVVTTSSSILTSRNATSIMASRKRLHETLFMDDEDEDNFTEDSSSLRPTFSSFNKSKHGISKARFPANQSLSSSSQPLNKVANKQNMLWVQHVLSPLHRTQHDIAGDSADKVLLPTGIIAKSNNRHILTKENERAFPPLVSMDPLQILAHGWQFLKNLNVPIESSVSNLEVKFNTVKRDVSSGKKQVIDVNLLFWQRHQLNWHYRVVPLITQGVDVPPIMATRLCLITTTCGNCIVPNSLLPCSQLSPVTNESVRGVHIFPWLEAPQCDEILLRCALKSSTCIPHDPQTVGVCQWRPEVNWCNSPLFQYHTTCLNDNKNITFFRLIHLSHALWGNLEHPEKTLGSQDSTPERIANSDEEEERMHCEAFVNTLDKSEEALLRCHSLSHWLREQLSNENKEMSDDIRSSCTKHLFFLLTSGNVEEACRLAASTYQRPKLAILISQCMSAVGGSELMRNLVRAQLNHCREYELDHLYEPWEMRILLLLAGYGEWEQSLGKMCHPTKGLSWLRTFAVHFWFLLPAKTPPEHAIQYAFHAYTAKFQQQPDMFAPPKPLDLPENSSSLCVQEMEEALDCAYHLLCLYCDRSHSLERLLEPACQSMHARHRLSLDWQNSWHLWRILTAVGYSHMSLPRQEQLHLSMSNQLEQAGQLSWAVFCLLHLPGEKARARQVQQLLSRHVTIVNGQHQQQDDENMEMEAGEGCIPGPQCGWEQVVCEELHVPVEWIHAAKALRARHERKSDIELQHLIAAKMFSHAQRLLLDTHLMSQLAVDCRFSQLFSICESVLDERTTVPMEKAGQCVVVYRDFVALLRTIARLVQHFDVGKHGGVLPENWQILTANLFVPTERDNAAVTKSLQEIIAMVSALESRSEILPGEHLLDKESKCLVQQSLSNIRSALKSFPLD